jgi:hypothetical protein
MFRTIPLPALSGRRHRAPGGDAGAGRRSPCPCVIRSTPITTKSYATPQNRPRRAFGAAWRRLPDRPPVGGIGSVGGVGELSGAVGGSDGASASFGPAAAPPSGAESAVTRASVATTSGGPARSLGARQSRARIASVSAARRRSTAPSVAEGAASSDPPLGSPFTSPPDLLDGSSGTTFHRGPAGPGHR